MTLQHAPYQEAQPFNNPYWHQQTFTMLCRIHNVNPFFGITNTLKPVVG